MHLLDTNIYIGATEHEAFAEQAAVFVERADQRLAVSSVVVAELLIGLRNDADRSAMLGDIYETVASRFVLTPSHEDWEQAGDALRQLGASSATPRRSFWNDLLLAASCARTATTLITNNLDDFRRIGRYIPVRVVGPWP